MVYGEKGRSPLVATPVTIRKRATQVFLFFCLGLLILVSRLFYVQVFNGQFFAQKAEDVRLRELTVEAKRGTIYDRKMRSLAVSVSVDSVVANPAEVRKSKKEKETARILSEVLAMEEDKILSLITKSNAGFVYVKRKVEPDIIKRLREHELPGISTVPESKRYYEKGKLASHILGITDTDSQGLEGIELVFDKDLKGLPGKVVAEYDAANRQLPQAQHAFVRPVDGQGVVLTIDETIQYITERELDKVMREHQPKAAYAIVMEVKTGKILAMANRPDFDPNERSKYPDVNRRNRAINDAYEPGSTFKIVTTAAAMEEGLYDPNKRFYDPGYVKVGDHLLKCWKSGGHGSQTFAEVVQNSCNPGFVELGMSLGMDRFYHYLLAFGFGKPTGITINGEATGILVPRASARTLDLATMSIGQANAVTPIQLITAVSASVNGGKLMKPLLVEKIIDNQNNLIKTFEPEVIRQIISEKTSKELALLLETVVSRGTGRNAYIEGFRVGGKTGTAEKIRAGGGYLDNEYVASFVGFAPANDPQIAALVVVDTPKGGVYYGGLVAAPVFRDIMADALRYLEIPPQTTEQQARATDADRVAQVVAPDLIGNEVKEAKDKLGRVGLVLEQEGSGSRVLSQNPIAGTPIKPGSRIKVALGSGDKPVFATKQGEAKVPNVKGYTIRQASEAFAAAGLALEVAGSGLAVEQSIAPNKTVSVGTVIKVRFAAALEEGP